MNDLTRHSDHLVDPDIRNAKRRAAWALRWKERFGVFPPSHEPASGIDINAKADAARLATCFAEDLIAPSETSADILMHPAMFQHPERHGNHGLRKLSRHRDQRPPTPPEAA